jgi:uncharacterized spore protein YtfJ
MKIMDQVKDVVGSATVFGEPYVKNGLTVIPASKVSVAGGGGGSSDQQGGSGFGLDARPIGVFVVKGDEVAWVPALDLSRVIILGQLVGLITILSLRSIVKALARRR